MEGTQDHVNHSEGGGQDLHAAMTYVKEIRDSIEKIVGPLQAQMATMASAIKHTDEQLDIIDKRTTPGNKFLAAGFASERYKTYEGVGDCWHAAWQGYNGRKIPDLYTRDQSEGVNSQGGVLIPTPIQPDVYRIMGEVSYPRRLFTLLPMTAPTLQIPVSVTGPIVYWPGEATAPTLTSTVPFVDPNPTLTAKVMMAVDKVTGELEADSIIPIRPLIGRIFLEAAALEENRVAFNCVAGGGQQAPFTGLIQTNGVASNALSSSGARAQHVGFKDIISLMFSINSKVITRGAFLMNPVTFQYIMGMEDDVHRPIYSTNWGGGLVGLQPPFDMQTGIGTILMGRPCFLSDQIPLGTSADEAFILYGDFTYAIMGLRQDIGIDFSREVYFLQNALAMRLIQRIGFLYTIPGAFGILKSNAN